MVEDKVAKHKEYLTDEGIYDHLSFDITDDLCCKLFFNHIFPKTKLMWQIKTKQQLNKVITKQINFVKLTLVNLKYYENGKRSSGIKEGFIYYVTNPFFKGYTKIGSTCSVEDRLKVYQTYCPMRGYQLGNYFFSNDKRKDEARLIHMFGGDHRDTEWVDYNLKDIENFFIEIRNNTKKCVIDFSPYYNLFNNLIV